jgi:hypothetical protein
MDQSPHNHAMLLTPQPPSSVKIPNTKSKPIKPSPIKQSISAEPIRLYGFDWPAFNQELFDEICIYFANVIGEIKTQTETNRPFCLNSTIYCLVLEE